MKTRFLNAPFRIASIIWTFGATSAVLIPSFQNPSKKRQRMQHRRWGPSLARPTITFLRGKPFGRFALKHGDPAQEEPASMVQSYQMPSTEYRYSALNCLHGLCRSSQINFRREPQNLKEGSHEKVQTTRRGKLKGVGNALPFNFLNAYLAIGDCDRALNIHQG